MVVIQKKGSTKLTFTFHKDYLNFAYDEKTGSGDIDVNYANIPIKTSIVKEMNEWLRNVGILWVIIGTLQILRAFHLGLPMSTRGFWLFVGMGCVGWAYLSKKIFTIFKTENGNFFVLQNKDHDEIIFKLQSRRKKQLFQWYGEIDFENDIENEIGKFRWLESQGVISQEEAENKIKQIELMSDNSQEFKVIELN